MCFGGEWLHTDESAFTLYSHNWQTHKACFSKQIQDTVFKYNRAPQDSSGIKMHLLQLLFLHHHRKLQKESCSNGISFLWWWVLAQVPDLILSPLIWTSDSCSAISSRMTSHFLKLNSDKLSSFSLLPPYSSSPSLKLVYAFHQSSSSILSMNPHITTQGLNIDMVSQGIHFPSLFGCKQNYGTLAHYLFNWLLNPLSLVFPASSF